MAHSFVAYIDESGDDGLANFREPGAGGGASNWLAIGAVIYRLTNDLEAVSWRDEIRGQMPEKKSRSIHFKDMGHGQRLMAARMIGAKPLRAIVVASNKRTIEPGTYDGKNQLYFYLTRYLIERMSWLAGSMRQTVREGDGSIRITFSRRGGMQYDAFKDYLRRLSEDPKVSIKWPVVDIDAVTAEDHSKRAGLQLADIVTASVAAGLEHDRYGNCERRYAELLKPIVYNNRGNYLSYGLKIVPSPAEMELSDEQTRMIDLFDQPRRR